ncbi:MAG TPA: hypothetical protein VEQ63_01565 [Bryobacteraceae bacterium]|nr:hypothetical protein [Bryobacteraceae bacterium]
MDGPTVSIEQLKAYESAVLDVASTEKVNVTAKLELAHREMGFDLIAFLKRHGLDRSGQLDYVVVTDALLHAECLLVLELIYRDAYNTAINDRYHGKKQEYLRRSNEAVRRLMEIGVGMTATPLRRPAEAAVGTLPSSATVPASCYVSVAVQRGEVTSSWSEPVLHEAPAGSSLGVSSPARNELADGWTVYAGPTQEKLFRQTPTAVPFGTIWLLPESGLRTDLPELKQQSPDWYVCNRRFLWRG